MILENAQNLMLVLARCSKKRCSRFHYLDVPGKVNLEIGEFLLLIRGNDIYDSMEEFDLAEVAEGLKEFELLLLELFKRD